MGVPYHAVMPEKHEKDIDDNILFENFQRGKYYLFEYFFDKYYPGLCVYACRMIQSKSTAEDLVQDFFIKLWEDKNHLDIHVIVGVAIRQGISCYKEKLKKR